MDRPSVIMLHLTSPAHKNEYPEISAESCAKNVLFRRRPSLYRFDIRSFRFLLKKIREIVNINLVLRHYG